MEQLIEASNPKIYCMSYPRSGNTWLRYAIEVLTQRPTAHHNFANKTIGMPLGLITGHALDYSKAPVWKVHFEHELNFPNYCYNNREDLLIFMIRNPKEALIRQLSLRAVLHSTMNDDKRNIRPYCSAYSYFDSLYVFDKWNPKKRLLLYYEDMISSPKTTFESLLAFLGDSADKLEEFFSEYTKHKQTGLTIYNNQGGSQSKGDDLLYHSKEISLEDRQEIDQWMEQKYTYLWETYLKTRYSEQVLEAGTPINCGNIEIEEESFDISQ